MTFGFSGFGEKPVAGDVNLDRIVMSVQILAFPLVTDQSMTGTKGKSSHDTERHE